MGAIVECLKSQGCSYLPALKKSTYGKVVLFALLLEVSSEVDFGDCGVSVLLYHHDKKPFDV